MNETGTMAIDQYGQTYHELGKFPRKELLEIIGATGAKKIYQDKGDGTVVHVGYIIRGLWLTLYNVTPREAKS